jgi:hypothetical protein
MSGKLGARSRMSTLAVRLLGYQNVASSAVHLRSAVNTAASTELNSSMNVCLDVGGQ